MPFSLEFAALAMDSSDWFSPLAKRVQTRVRPAASSVGYIVQGITLKAQVATPHVAIG
jgi:hypothetical protein